MSKLLSPIPKYARLPLLAALLFNCAVYWLTRLVTSGAVHYDLSVGLDAALPFVPAFIVIYVLAFAQWLVGYVMICRESPGRCYRVMSGEMTAELLCLVLFLAMPTSMVRPEVTGTDIFSRLTALIYALDTPDNLFPSLHCLQSWMVFRGTLGAKGIPAWYKAAMLIFTLLVFASVVLVKQHLILDIPSGVAAAELGLFIATRLDLGRFLRRLNARFRAETGDLT